MNLMFVMIVQWIQDIQVRARLADSILVGEDWEMGIKETVVLVAGFK